MRHKKGFLLLECCVYLMICAILTVTIMRWLTQTAAEAGRVVESTDRSVMSNLVHDVLMRDIQTAPNNRAAWLCINADQIVWKMNDSTTVGWYNQKNQLIRKEGTYDAIRKEWGKHHTSTIGYGVTTFMCEERQEGDMMQGIKTTLCLEGDVPSVRYVRIRNGRAS
jgi:hypothetical protein